MILAIIHNKGGTGKTTSAVNRTAGLSMKGHRALLADRDSQASASRSLGIERAAFAPSVADAILDGWPLKSVIRRTAVEVVDLVTGLPEVSNADLALATMPDREPRLRVAIGPVRQDYAFVILDCLLSLLLLSVNALVAAQQGSGLDLTAYGTEAAIQDAVQKRLKG